MTKNICIDKKTIQVLDADGVKIGSTYPKRAVGLVKKGRAYYMNDFTIHLNMSDTIQKSEVIKMDLMNIEAENKQEKSKVLKLYFDARNWKFNCDCSHNVGNRSFMVGPDGNLSEAYMIADWSNNWTEIISETLLLPKHTNCSFTFWLNGGENDRNDEVCRFQVIFNNDQEQCYTYNLNRNFIRPRKKMNGWELYEIPFRTLDNEYTQLKFAAIRAYMTVMTAKDFSAYEQFPDSPDPYEKVRPQRHNLIFEDGFPKNGWYSTKTLEKKYPELKLWQPRSKGSDNETSSLLSAEIQEKFKEISERMNEVTRVCEKLESIDIEELIDRVRGALENACKKQSETEADNLNLDEIVDGVMEEVRDELRDMLTDSAEELRDTLEELSDQMEDWKDTLE
ncbi:MAG: apolipoprotein A1/A4/E family protein [Lachnospiraceae bacterium]|nr:apolipoprotein A1/A4/E family protein [Lachnospiraceae bacterium]